MAEADESLAAPAAGPGLSSDASGGGDAGASTAAAGASASASAGPAGEPGGDDRLSPAGSEESEDDGYVPPDESDISDVRKAGDGRPEDDESMKRYKAALLGDSGAEGEPLLVTIDQLVLEHPEDPSAKGSEAGPTLVVPMGEGAAAGEAPPLAVKAGALRRVSIRFRVHGQIVFGLKLRMRIKGATSKITLDHMSMMMGSYAPKAEPQQYTAPPSRYPASMFARGRYVADCEFVDDRGNTHLRFSYSFAIGRAWDWSHPAVLR